MSTRRKSGLILAAVSIAALALTGCTGGGNDNGGGGGESSAAPIDLKNTGWKTAERDAIKDGGTLTIPVDTIPQNYNQLHVDSGTVDDQMISGLYYADYVNFTPEGEWEPNPDYVQSMEVVSTDPQVVEIKINPEAVWSNGVPMSVDDVKAAWTANNGTNEAYQTISTNVWKDIASVEQGDNPQDVLITFKNTNADWASIFNIMPAFAENTPEAYNTAWAKGPVDPATGEYVSGGPFIVSKIDQTGQVLTFKRNPKWWGDTPKLDTIIFKKVDRSGLAQAYRNKEIDIMRMYGDADNYGTAKKRDDGTIERSLGTTYRHITLNGTSSVFKDRTVREAFARSINRKVIAQSRLSPVDSPIVLLNSLIYVPGQKGYQDNATKVIGRDLEKAKKLLDEAGWKEGDNGYRTKDGKTLTVRFVVPSQVPASAQVAEQVQAQTKQAGFKVKIDTVPSDDFFTKYIHVPERDYDATYFAFQGTPFPVSSAESIFYPADSGQNFSGVTTKKLGTMWNKANAELDDAKRIKDANAIDKVIIKQLSMIPLFPEPYAWGVKKGLVNYGPAQFQVYSVQWTDVGWAK